MKKLLIGMAVVLLSASPVLAGQCPLLQKQIDTAVGNRFDAGAASARSLAAEGAALHSGGKHAESVAKYQEAAKAAGIELKMK